MLTVYLYFKKSLHILGLKRINQPTFFINSRRKMFLTVSKAPLTLNTSSSSSGGGGDSGKGMLCTSDRMSWILTSLTLRLMLGRTPDTFILEKNKELPVYLLLRRLTLQCDGRKERGERNWRTFNLDGQVWSVFNQTRIVTVLKATWGESHDKGRSPCGPFKELWGCLELRGQSKYRPFKELQCHL